LHSIAVARGGRKGEPALWHVPLPRYTALRCAPRTVRRKRPCSPTIISPPSASTPTDTLWQNEQFFRLTEQRLVALLGDWTHGEDVSARLLEAERRNLGIYGFGIKGFTLSMIETAIAVTDGQAPASVIAEILTAGREMLSHPIETLPHVHETLERLAGTFKLVLITKGDLFDQERKLAQSGLADMFDAVEIVSDKSAAAYARIFSRHGDGPEKA